MTLFEPIQVGPFKLQHRVVLAPLTRYRGDKLQAPTDLGIEYYSQRATPGGLLITEGILTSDNTSGYTGVCGLYTDHQVNQWRKVVDAVHDKKGFIFAQLWHLGRAASSIYRINNKDNNIVVGPSPIAARGISGETGEPFEVPHELTIEEIQDLIQEYVTAAKNAIKAGFDGVEILGAFGYLVDQFINSSSNQRTDKYGGSIENRARFPLELVEAVSNAIGVERTSIRLSPWGRNCDVEDETPYETWGYIVKQLNPELAYVSFSEPRDDYLEAADLVNTVEPFRKAWKGRVFISGGGYTSNPHLISKVAEEHPDTLIAVGRAFIANPDLVERLKHQWPLNKYNRDTFYTHGEEGYTDYTFYEPKDQKLTTE
ncbi:hypothetical protein BDA99DRAFT_551849 [Phascolomyces articulosus]|uniref:NADH:flavin oxidoreductase/NADH oxidase N-terminal domain-containing protein n=1 Tax=Phascolomyces articulosus TaxID=60185 RepID=A0AAD5PDN8_9FUNG|nr:hypothetical protein BDA99DRAFT_551849 [Phascolomyces articulosus]